MTTEFSSADKRKAVGYEIRDLLAGSAFPIMLQLVFSASIILFADSSLGELALQIVALVFGEGLLIGAYLIFGRQNGIAAVRKSVQNVTRRENSDDIKAHFRVGEYALWKGFVIGFITCVPFILFQFVQGVYPNVVCEFILKYAFGWATYPLDFAAVSDWLNLVWIIPLTCVHAAAYYWGGALERKRQQKVADAAPKGKKRNKEDEN